MNNILIIGAGSIGALMGVSLVKAGLKVTFAGRPQSSYTEQIQHRGLTIVSATDTKLSISPLKSQVRFVDTETYLAEKFDLIIVALKSNDLAQVTSYIKFHSTSDTLIVHAQNGIPYWWFNDELYLQSLNPTILNKLGSRRHLDSVDPQGTILSSLGNSLLVGCVVKAPCHKTSEGYIQVKKPPKLILGLTKSGANSEQQARVKRLCEIFSEHGTSAIYTNDIRTTVCHKLAINATTNVLSALTGKLIGDLTSNLATNNLIKQIIREINQIFQIYAIKAENLPTESQIYSYIQEPGSQSHLPSLAQDFSQHRAGEISLITAPVEMAKIANLAVPTLSSLSELLQLGQTYTLKVPHGNFPILTFDLGEAKTRSEKSFSFCKLTQDIFQSRFLNQIQKLDVLSHLMQVNVSALS